MRTFFKIVISLAVEIVFIAAGKSIGEAGLLYLLTHHNGSSDGTPIGTILVSVGGVVGMVLGAIFGGVTLLYGWSRQQRRPRTPV